MTRDPARIPRVLAALKEFWTANPERTLADMIHSCKCDQGSDDDEAIAGCLEEANVRRREAALKRAQKIKR